MGLLSLSSVATVLANSLALAVDHMQERHIKIIIWPVKFAPVFYHRIPQSFRSLGICYICLINRAPKKNDVNVSFLFLEYLGKSDNETDDSDVPVETSVRPDQMGKSGLANLMSSYQSDDEENSKNTADVAAAAGKGGKCLFCSC